MRKERMMAIITVTMTVAFFFSLLWGYGQYQQSRRAMALLENEYQRSYYNYLAAVKEMGVTAGKAQSASALQRAVLLGRLSTLANSAVGHMSALPVQHTRYQRSVSYLNQVGDYADSLGQKLARSEMLAEQDQHNLADIYGQLKDIYAQMVEMETAVAEGGIVFASAYQNDSWWQAARQALGGGSRAVQGSSAAYGTADGYFSRANGLLDEVALLNYDGKYSSHMLSLPAVALDGQRRVSMAEALSAARAFLAQAGYTDLTLTTQEELETEAAIPLYSFRFAEKGQTTDSLYITASRAGGKIISFFNARNVDTALLTAEAGQAVADKLLAASGFSGMKLVSRQSLKNELLLKYAYCQDDVLCYPDGVEVKVALDNGRVTALNAHEYWLNYHKRTLPTTLPSLDTALAGWGGSAPASATALAIISNGAGGETLCHEIRCTVGEEEYLNYIGAEQLLEEQVLRSYTADDGSFYTR